MVYNTNTRAKGFHVRCQWLLIHQFVTVLEEERYSRYLEVLRELKAC